MVTTSHDPHAQLRALYLALLNDQTSFDEFKHLLSQYPVAADTADAESPEASALRARLNDRIREWTAGPFAGLSAAQVMQWRAILVDERINVALSPWKESNSY